MSTLLFDSEGTKASLCRYEDMMSLLRHFDRLQTMSDQLETKLDLDEAGFSGSGGVDYRTRRDLRERISEISEEIFALEQRSRHFQN